MTDGWPDGRRVLPHGDTPTAREPRPEPGPPGFRSACSPPKVQEVFQPEHARPAEASPLNPPATRAAAPFWTRRGETERAAANAHLLKPPTRRPADPPTRRPADPPARPARRHFSAANSTGGPGRQRGVGVSRDARSAPREIQLWATITSTLCGLASSLLGRVTVSKPSLKLAVILSPCTGTGSWMSREKRPVTLSHRYASGSLPSA
jgi:hypothetical protein